MDDERNRILLVLLKQIKFHFDANQQWQEHSGVTEQFKKEQAFGYECAIRALSTFGSKALGYRAVDLEEMAKKIS